jgi:hypothetical protein
MQKQARHTCRAGIWLTCMREALRQVPGNARAFTAFFLPSSYLTMSLVPHPTLCRLIGIKRMSDSDALRVTWEQVQQCGKAWGGGGEAHAFPTLFPRLHIVHAVSTMCGYILRLHVDLVAFAICKVLDIRPCVDVIIVVSSARPNWTWRVTGGITRPLNTYTRISRTSTY